MGPLSCMLRYITLPAIVRSKIQLFLFSFAFVKLYGVGWEGFGGGYPLNISYEFSAQPSSSAIFPVIMFNDNRIIKFIPVLNFHLEIG